ncbi:MAG TPA: HAD family hydrolase [Oligoflexia bacterium]|nr:HAD family hydrolase [Oligoflexia bacterium]HMR25291.1 HAD family hydrolase [Oligoflexia bacterium]
MSTQKTLNLKQKKLFIFDLDGTLIDSSLDICNSLAAACNKLGITPPSIDELKQYLHQGSRQILLDLLKDRALAKKVYPHFTHFYQKQLLVHTKLYDQVESILTTVSQYAKIALMSNKREAPCHTILEGLNIKHLFSMIVGGDTYPVKKPHPLPLQKICQHLAIDSKDSVMIGDSPVDIIAAQKANMDNIAVLSGFTAKKPLLDSMPSIYLNHVSDMINYI